MMTWEQMLLALRALAGEAGVSLKMRKPGSWYVALHGVEIGGDGMLSSVGGDGNTPEDAVVDAWLNATTLEPQKHLVINAGSERRKHIRWNGFMWADVGEAVTP